MAGGTYTYQGAITQSYTVAASGTFQITAYGAQGGSEIHGTREPGGKGAEIGGDFSLVKGEVLRIVVGGAGVNGGFAGGGGGGSFVIETFDGSGSVHDPLVIAGGGGGAGDLAGYAGQSGGSGGNGGSQGTSAGGAGGTSGAGGQPGTIPAVSSRPAGGGGGYSGGNGGAGNKGTGAFVTPGESGSGYGSSHGSYAGGLVSAGLLVGTYSGGNGGFGGGGGAGGYFVNNNFNQVNSGGGGGGYSGGGGGALRGGGGGGSLDNGTNQVLASGENAGNGLVDITYVGPPICYLRGTRILTPTGEVTVQDLRIGDRVVTRFGGIRPIRWIGRQSHDARFIGADRSRMPVCIRAGALGDRLPARDLYVSPGHSMLVDGNLLLARNLVNGLTITQDWAPPEIHYFQIELDTHDCVVAEGAWSESYADGPGLRDKFHNFAEFEALYPDHPPPVEHVPLCAPRPEHGMKLDAALRGVVARAGAGLKPGRLRGWVDIVEAPWRIEGWAQDMTRPELPVLLEVLLEDRVAGTVLACQHRPDLAKAGHGQGNCAFALAAPVRLRPETLPSLRLRRASDHAELPRSQECLDCLGPAQETDVQDGLRLVA